MPRPKGSPNKATKAREEILSRKGETPLSYMLKVLRDERESQERRQWAAEKAAPYVHPRLTSIDAKLQAEINGRVENVQVIDVRALAPEIRERLKQSLLAVTHVAADATDAEFEEIDDEDA